MEFDKHFYYLSSDGVTILKKTIGGYIYRGITLIDLLNSLKDIVDKNEASKDLTFAINERSYLCEGNDAKFYLIKNTLKYNTDLGTLVIKADIRGDLEDYNSYYMTVENLIIDLEKQLLASELIKEELNRTKDFSNLVLESTVHYKKISIPVHKGYFVTSENEVILNTEYGNSGAKII